MTTISVILPTACAPTRAASLRRAIESILSQTGVRIELFVVTNGSQRDPDIVAALNADNRLRTKHIDEGNVSIARYAGVSAASGDFFCFVDDDDVYLPDALVTRLAIFSRNPEADVVATNGLIQTGELETPLVDRNVASEISEHPGPSLLKSNWFASAAPMFRRSTVEAEVFNFRHRHFEWTYLFFLLLSKGKRFAYEDAITYKLFADTPSSASKSDEYAAEYAAALSRICSLPIDDQLKKRVHQKYLIALNARANSEIADGRTRAAWLTHLECITSGGWRYLPFTRRLISETLFSARPRH